MTTKRYRDIISLGAIILLSLLLSVGTMQALLPYLDICDIDIHGLKPAVISIGSFSLLYFFLMMMGWSRVLFFMMIIVVIAWIGVVLMAYGFSLYDAFSKGIYRGIFLVLLTVALFGIQAAWSRYRR